MHENAGAAVARQPRHVETDQGHTTNTPGRQVAGIIREAVKQQENGFVHNPLSGEVTTQIIVQICQRVWMPLQETRASWWKWRDHGDFFPFFYACNKVP